MVLQQLSTLLLNLSDAGNALAESQEIDDFQRLAEEACSSINLNLQHLAEANKALQTATDATWDQFQADGVVAADVARWGLRSPVPAPVAAVV